MKHTIQREKKHDKPFPAAFKQILTVADVAQMKGVSETTVTRALIDWYEDGKGLRGEQRHRFWLIAKSDAEAWIPPRPRNRKKASGRTADGC